MVVVFPSSNFLGWVETANFVIVMKQDVAGW
jgi:hypothetical protein